MSGLQKVQSGDALKIPAATFNAMIDAARDHQQRRHGQEQASFPAFRQSGIVLVRNDSGTDRDRFDVLGIDAVVISPAENLDAFKNRVVLAGITPDAETHFGRFVVLMEPIRAGALGLGCVSGVCPARVHVTDPDLTRADVAGGATASLVTRRNGAAQILWRAGGSSQRGVQWAVVRLGLPDPQRVFALDDCEGRAPTLYVANDLQAQVGRVVLVGGVCYEVREPAPDEIDCLAQQCVTILREYDTCEDCLGCWLLTDCDDPGHTIVTNTDLAGNKGGVVRLADGICYEVSGPVLCLNAAPVSVDGSYADCEACQSCYHLTNCWDAGDTLVIDNDLEAITEADPATMVAEGYVFEINGKCYRLTAWNASCAGAQTVEVSAFYLSCGDCGCFKLTECPGGAGGVIYVRGATDRDGDPVRLRDYVGQVVRLGVTHGLKCYQVEESGDCGETQSVTVYEAYDDCDACRCFLLEDCEAALPDIVTYTDLNAHVGRVVKIGSICYTVAEASDCTDAEPVEIDSDHDDCDTCLRLIKYRLVNDCHLEDCDGAGGANAMPDIITREDLHAAVGLYVKVAGHCYKVAIEPTAEVTHDSLAYQGPFQTCDACLAAPVDAKKAFLTNLKLDGINLVAETEEMIIKAGLIVGFCKSDDITIEGTDCPEEPA